jgi:hypothetical protein
MGTGRNSRLCIFMNFFGAEGSSKAPTCWQKIQDISQHANNIKIICMGTGRNRTSSGLRDCLGHPTCCCWPQPPDIYVCKHAYNINTICMGIGRNNRLCIFMSLFVADGSSRAPSCWPQQNNVCQQAYNIKIICMGTGRKRTSSGLRDRLKHTLAGQSLRIYVSKLITSRLSVWELDATELLRG